MMEFLDDPDFGLPDSFAPAAPSGFLIPSLPVPQEVIPGALESLNEGFCFRLAPTDQVGWCRSSYSATRLRPQHGSQGFN